MIFDTISVKAHWERWCRWNCDLRVINAWKRHFLSYRNRHHDAQITWPYAYYVTLGSRCKMANSSSEDKTDTMPERPTRIQPYQFEPVRQDFERVPEHRVSFEANPMLLMYLFHGVCEIAFTEVLATHMGMMRRSKKVSSFELYKFNPLLPHCGSIARELMHCYTWGCLRIVTVRDNILGRHSLTFLSTTHIHSLLKNLRWQPHWLPRLTSFWESHVTNENPRLVSASLQKRKSIKNPIKHFLFFYFIKSETSDSFVNHFHGHFCILKNLGLLL